MRIEVKRKHSPAMLRTAGLALLGTLALAACEDAPAGPVAAGARADAAAAQAAGDAGQRLARALGLALRDANVRVQLRNALRQSPYHEHKLLLQDYVATREGRRLVDAAAAAAGVDAATVRGWIAALPALDFYAPVLRHRQTWRGTDDVVVGLNLDVDDPRLAGYGPDGAVVRLDARDGVPARAVLLLHPAEPKTVRAGGPAGPGEVIEDRSAVRSLTEEGSCNEETAIIECPTEPGIGTVYFGPILYQYRAWMGDGWGDNEIMIKHYDSFGTRIWEFHHSGYSEYELATVSEPTVVGRSLKVWERDSGFEPSGDDYWGTAPFPAAGTTLSVYGRCGDVYHDTNYWLSHDYEQVCGSNLDAPIHTIDLTYRRY